MSRKGEGVHHVRNGGEAGHSDVCMELMALLALSHLHRKLLTRHIAAAGDHAVADHEETSRDELNAGVWMGLVDAVGVASGELDGGHIS